MTCFRKWSALAALVAGLGSGAVSAQQLTFMTGPQGGAWIPLGGALKGLWEKAIPGLQIQTTPGAGISNVRGIDESKAHIGMANSSTTFDGIAGNKPYPKKVTKVCQLANLYPQYFQVVALADAKINSFRDLAGKSLVTQPRGNTAEVLTATVLELNGLDYKKLGRASFQASFPGELYRCGIHAEGRSRACLHAGHHRPRIERHGSGECARHQDGTGRRQDDGRTVQGKSWLHAADHQGRHLSEAERGRACHCLPHPRGGVL